jgi:primosomal protein N' (replication factor Y)
VPFREESHLAIILDIKHSDHKEDWIKDIISLIPNYTLYPYQVLLIQWIPIWYFCLIHTTFWLFFPKNLREKLQWNSLKYKEKTYSYDFNYTKDLTEWQIKALHQIEASVKKTILLWWVTGSGKTEIYIQLIKKYLNLGRQTLILLPEILLWNQITERLEAVFWKDIIFISSDLSDAKKTSAWLDIYYWSAKIIIGTRSSIFYPYKNLWCIIMDEEHDSSYASESAPRYKTLEVVGQISKIREVRHRASRRCTEQQRARCNSYNYLQNISKKNIFLNFRYFSIDYLRFKDHYIFL